MQRRFFLSGLLAALALSAAACADETPTFVGDDDFPPGSIPVTREVILPASVFFRDLGTFTGFSSASELPFLVVANEFDEGLNAHALARFGPFPEDVTYTRNGSERRDSLFTYAASSLLVRVDTAATTPGPVTVQVYEAAQDWHAPTATWTLAVDTGAVETPWTEPGGTRGALLAEGTFQNTGTGGDSLVLALTGAQVTALAQASADGVVITTSTAGARAQLRDVVLRAAIRPDSAAPDTTIVQVLGSAGTRTTVYTPEQPAGGPGILAVGGVRGARTLLELDPDQPVPGCPVGDCATVPLRDVLLNEVAVLLRPVDTPNGFDRLSAIPLSLRAVSEPELGAATPLGPRVLDVDPDLELQAYFFRASDTLAVLPITGLSRSLAATDSITRTFALVSEIPGSVQPPSFGVALFEAEPRLRIVYTLPARRRLP